MALRGHIDWPCRAIRGDQPWGVHAAEDAARAHELGRLDDAVVGKRMHKIEDTAAVREEALCERGCAKALLELELHSTDEVRVASAEHDRPACASQQQDNSGVGDTMGARGRVG